MSNYPCRSVKLTALLGLLTTAIISAQDTNAKPGFRFESIEDKALGLWEGTQPVLVYNHGNVTPRGSSGGRGRACYFHPVYGLGGEILTDDFPKDHTYHRGLYFAWPHIKIGDKEYELWTARGELKQVFRRFTTQKADEHTAELGIENAWVIANEAVVCEEIHLRIHRMKNDARSIDVRATWTPLTQPLTLSGAQGKSYGGLNFRFGPRSRPIITVPAKTELPTGVTASEGRVSDDLVMTKLAWADFASQFEGSPGRSGAAIFVHPRHRDFPPTWMTRHYGLMSVGWPGVQPQTFPAGQPITCQYRLWVHRGQRSLAEIQQAYDESWQAP